MFKKIALLLAFILCLIVPLSGCSLFSLDNYTYLNQVVATINYSNSESISITKKELIEAYNNYQSTLEESGYTGQTAIDKLIQLLINKEVILKETERLIDEEEITVTNKNLNEIWNETYKALISNIAQFESEIIEAWKLPIPSELSEDETDENVYYQAYEKQAEVVKVTNPDSSVQWKIQSLDSEESVNEDLIYEVGEETSSLHTAVNNRMNGSNVLEEALKRYIKLLKDNENGLNLSIDDDSVFEREIERIYDNVKQNLYVSLYSDYFEVKNGYSIVSVNQVLDYLSAHMLASFTEYSVDYSAYESDILSARENCWYVMDDDYFYVSHILVSFTDEQKADLTELEELRSSGQITSGDYEIAKQRVADTTVVQDYGENTSMNPNDLLNLLKTQLNGKDEAGKTQVLNEFIYKYSGDGGNKNQIYEYVVGENNSQMVDEFNEAARALYDNGDGHFGDLSECVVTEYGVHILCYMSRVTNAFTIQDSSNFSLISSNTAQMEETIATLTTTKLSPLYERTLFDYIYEKLVEDKFSQFESMNIAILKQNLDIKIYTGNYADLF
ncbi:MAG: hypothetical protein PHR96_01865 [Clostridia bacterium]|nr:hypothetical protein [Clostridia bacterium]